MVLGIRHNLISGDTNTTVFAIMMAHKFTCELPMENVLAEKTTLTMKLGESY